MRPSRLAGAAVAMALTCLAVMPAIAAELVPPPSRNVTPPGVTPGPEVDGPLVREPVPPPPPPPPRWHRYFLPVTTDAATFEVKGRTIKVAGVTPPAADATCPGGGDGAAWPCGRTALISLRMFLRGRAIECFFATGDPADPLVVPCRVGPTDIGLWLLQQGWARPADGARDAYREAGEQARCAGKGMWRKAGRDDSCPSDWRIRRPAPPPAHG